MNDMKNLIATQKIMIDRESKTGVTEDGLMVDIFFNGAWMQVYDSETGEELSRYITWKITWIVLEY